MMPPLTAQSTSISPKRPIKAHQFSIGNFRAIDFLNFVVRIFQEIQHIELRDISGCLW